MTSHDELNHLTVDGAARETGIKPETIRWRLRHGLMRGTFVCGRVWLIPRAEVERAKTQGKLKTGPKPKTAKEQQP